MKKNLFLFIFLFVSVLFLFSSVYACLPPNPEVIIKCEIRNSLFQQDTTCITDNCSVNVSKNQYNQFSLNIPDLEKSISLSKESGILVGDKSDIQKNASIYQGFLVYLSSICVEDTKDVNSIFNQEVKNWLLTTKTIENLVFVPYSKDLESELTKTKNALGNCYSKDFKKVGNWLVVSGTIRDYCYSVDANTNGMCPQEKKSYFRFFIFLITNLNANTIQYLVVYLVLVGIAIYIIVYLLKKVIKTFFKKSNFNPLATQRHKTLKHQLLH